MLQLESYDQHEQHLPSAGKFIIAQFDRQSIIVYQAFNDHITEFALKHQRFGGNAYDFERMTWLKPSFLWMMYYSGWAKKENQENVLAIRMSREGFDEILKTAVTTRFYAGTYTDQKSWEDELRSTEIQLQWESYHDLFGNKTERRAVKIGLRGDMLQRFNENWILEIRNITPFVREQQQLLSVNKLEFIQLPHERAYAPDDLSILRKIDATTITL